MVHFTTRRSKKSVIDKARLKDAINGRVTFDTLKAVERNEGVLQITPAQKLFGK